MDTLTEDKYEYYKNSKNLEKIIKIQSYIRMKQWVIKYMNNNILKLITDLYKRDKKKYVYEPTLFGDNSKENIKSLKISFEQKQKQMKEGMLSQLLIGNWIGWEDLGSGKNPSGLDCRKKDNTIIMEVKNKWNTVKGSDIKKSLYPTLVAYKKENPSTRCIWAIINPKNPKSKKLSEKITHNGVEIEKIQGRDLFKLVFTIGNIDYSEIVLNIIKQHIHNL
jgi:hypothetical protein